MHNLNYTSSQDVETVEVSNCETVLQNSGIFAILIYRLEKTQNSEIKSKSSDGIIATLWTLMQNF